MELIISDIPPTICLNMIVKNESHIIKNTLEKLCNKIQFSYWVICDTGSTDNTRQIITDFFNEKNIPGELHNNEWINFAHNRNMALNEAFNKTDLLLVFDADDEIHGNITMPKIAKSDGYSLNFGNSGGISYQRILLVNNKIRWEFKSVIHEYINCLKPNPQISHIEGNYYVESGRSGSRNSDPEKYLKDAKILEESYYEAKINNDHLYLRYGFYCANSYKDSGKTEEAIKWYKITLGNENWSQEKYMCCLNLYNLYNSIDEKEKGLYYLVESFNYDLERMECVSLLIKEYCCRGFNTIAYNYYCMIKDFYENKYLQTNNTHKLFVENDKANFFLPYYMILVADKVKETFPEAKQTIVKMYEIIFTKKYPMTDGFFFGNLLYNLQFFIEFCAKTHNFINLANEYLDFSYIIGANLDKCEFLLKPEYINAGINVDNYLVKDVTDKRQKFSTEICENSKNILIYTGFLDFQWNYTYTQNNALGGSEKAVAYLSKCFPKDYNIYISGNVTNEIIDNIQYIHSDQLTNLINLTPFHTVIVSRYISFYEMFKECSYYQSYIWAHDILLLPYGCSLNENQILKKWNKYINKCICLTEWHKNEFIGKYPILKDKISLINNGIDCQSFSIETNKKIKNKFIYSSRPDRGLNILLELWPQILENLPDATLVISFYGTFPSDQLTLKTIIDSYDSIQYLGKLKFEQLYEEMASSEYWLYPTHWPETSCITALEMLMSGVICLYYPVAGLVNTLGNYGIPVEKCQEIETINNLTVKRKTEIIKRGKEYALSCSWANRANEWVNLISKKSDDTIAILNGFPFHYEMFGYILNYATNNNIFVDIYTNTDNNLGWFDFYNCKFNNFRIINIDIFFNIDKNRYKYIFLTTDDDSCFMNKNISYENIIIINHYWKIRNYFGEKYLNCAPFKDSNLDFCYPIYPIFKSHDKEQNNIITIIGCGGRFKYNIDIINRFCIINETQITLNFITRNFNKTLLIGLSNKFKVNIYSDLDTNRMIDILKQTNYVYVTFSNNNDMKLLYSCSGSLQLAFNTLCKCIILDSTNTLLQIKNCVTYNENENIPIYLDNVDFNKLEEERQEYINKFENYLNNINNTKILIPKRIIQTWENKNFEPEFQKIVDNWKINNPDYEYILFDANEREEFIKDNFDINILNIYNCIIPGAYKVDLFRYCYLYIYGGVYIDIDTLCLGKLDDFLLSNIEFILPIDLNINPNEGNHNLACGFIASIPKHPILLECINKIVNNVKNQIIPPSKLDFTGPGVLGRCVNKFLGFEETSSFINKEGIKKNIYFLKFEKQTEYIKNTLGNILFQNKNGNQLIIDLYKEECNKLTNYVCWVNTNNVINKNVKKNNINEVTKYKLSACLLIKNETENLNDWLKHYINQGVEHFFITSNNSTDGIDTFIENCEYKNMITLIIDNRDLNIYSNSVNHKQILCDNFYNIIKVSTEWCILVDIDEFMYGKNGFTLSSFIDTFDEDIGCFYVYWNIFKPTLDAENNISDHFSLEKSTKRINLDLITELSYDIKFCSKFGKSIFRTSMLKDDTQLWIHKVPTSGKIINNYYTETNYIYDNDDVFIWSEENYNKLNIVLNHYPIRNKSDYNKKIKQLENNHRYCFIKGIVEIANLDNSFFIDDYLLSNSIKNYNENDSINIIDKNEKKNLAIMCYGQFRNYKTNLLQNINMLKPIIKNYNVHLFILSDKLENGNFSKENEEDIKNIFLFYDFNIHIFDYIENYDFFNDENKYVDFFFGNINNNLGIGNNFVPRLLYRKYILNKLKNNYISINNIEIDLNLYCRLFDTKISNNLTFKNIEKEIDFLVYNHNYVFGSSDTFFIGSQISIDFLFDIVKGKLYHSEIWQDNTFNQFIASMDLCLYQNKATYSPEIQYISHIYYNSYFKYKNIRVDFNNKNSEENNKALYNIILDPERFTFTSNCIVLKKDYIELINKQIPLNFLNYFTSQGLIDYNKDIGQEHYKLLCCISQQIKNGIIIDIGAHQGNSTVALAYSLINKHNNIVYSFDIKEMIEYPCRKYFDDYSINYCLENVFEKNIKNNYKQYLLSSRLIMIDIDPHNGILEYEMYLWLKENNYKGFILYDDIFIKKGHVANYYDKTLNNMIDFWNKIPNDEKIDITHIGHWSGTGLVCFDFIKNKFIFD